MFTALGVLQPRRQRSGQSETCGGKSGKVGQVDVPPPAGPVPDGPVSEDAPRDDGAGVWDWDEPEFRETVDFLRKTPDEEGVPVLLLLRSGTTRAWQEQQRQQQRPWFDSLQ